MILGICVVRLLVFQDVCPLICEVAVNRQLFVEEEDDDNVELLTTDDDDDDDDCIGCCPLDDEIPDELYPNKCF